MDFDKQKKDILGKKDKSKKGDVDEKIKDLCELINSKENYFTASSCAGRTMLIKVPEGNIKNLAEWIIITHDLADFGEFRKALDIYCGKDRIYFKEESAILHVCCRTMGDAQNLINTARENGFKHSGIVSIKNKIVVELICSEKFSSPVYDRKKLITDEYLRYLVELGNEKLKISWDCIEKLRKDL